MSSLSKCNSFQSRASFLSFKFEPVWHITDCSHYKVSLLSTATVYHFGEYLKFFELVSTFTTFYLFECVVKTFLTVILLHVSPWCSFTLLFLLLHKEGKVLPKALANQIVNRSWILGRRGILLLIFLTRKSLCQCFLNLFLYPKFYQVLIVLIKFFLNVDLSISLNFIDLFIRIIFFILII